MRTRNLLVGSPRQRVGNTFFFPNSGGPLWVFSQALVQRCFDIDCETQAGLERPGRWAGPLYRPAAAISAAVALETKEAAATPEPGHCRATLGTSKLSRARHLLKSSGIGCRRQVTTLGDRESRARLRLSPGCLERVRWP